MSASPISWTRAIFAHTVKTHVMPTSFADELIAAYKAQGFELHPGFSHHPGFNREIVIEAGNDIGGPCIVGRPEETFHVRGLAYGMASENVRVFYDAWRVQPIRLTPVTSREYVKVHGAHCLVLEPADHEALIRDMGARIDEANARHEAFLVEWSRKTAPLKHSHITPNLTARINRNRRGN